MAWFVTALATLAAGLAIWKGVRSRPSAGSAAPSEVPTDARSEPPRRTPPPPATRPVKTCPVCHGEYLPDKRFCVRDGAPLHEGPAAGPFSQGMICPTCRRGYTSDSIFCPEDSDELMPYGLFAASGSTRPPIRVDGRKICPECGVRHASGHLFCGHDGAELVVVN